MSENNYEAPATPVTREEAYLDAILRGLNNSSPAPEIPAPVWRIEQYLAAIAEAVKTGALPPVTSSDNGKVLAVEDGAWAAQQKKFLVTLTPTALDYSGTMDKTVAEINAAYEAGQEIWFRIIMSSNAYVETPLTYCINDGIDYPGFGTQAIEFSNGVLIVARIPSTNDGTRQTYSTSIYSLTPAS